MNRWQLHSTSPMLSTDGNLSLPQTPRRQKSKYLPPLPMFTELTLVEPPGLKKSRSDEVETHNNNNNNNKFSPLQRPKSRSLEMPASSHPFFSDINNSEEKPKVGFQDSSPPKPQRIGSITKKQKVQTRRVPTRRHHRRRSRSLDQFFLSATEDSSPTKPQRISSGNNDVQVSRDVESITKKQKVPTTRHHRRRSRSLDHFFFSSFNQDAPPPKPQRILSGNNDVPLHGRGDFRGHRRSRSRSMDMQMHNYVLVSPSQSPSYAVTTQLPHPLQTPETRRNSRFYGRRNHRRTRSRSLDLTLRMDFDFLNIPKCESSRGPCQPSPSLMIGSTPTTEKKNNTSQCHRKGKHRRMRSRSLGPDLQRILSDHNSTSGQPETDRNNNILWQEHQRGGRWTIPSYPQRQLMRILSDQNSTSGQPETDRNNNILSQEHQRGGRWIIPSYPQRQLMRRVSSLTVDDEFFPHRRAAVAGVADPAPTIALPNKDPNHHHHEAANQVLPTSPAVEESNKTERANDSSSHEKKQTAEKVQSEVPPPPPSIKSKDTPPSPFCVSTSSCKSKYTPPSPLWFSSPPSRSPRWNYSVKRKKPKLSPFVSEALGVSSNGYAADPNDTLKSQASREAPMKGHRIDSMMSTNNENINREQTKGISTSQHESMSLNDATKSRGSGGRRVYMRPLSLQPVSTFLLGLRPAKSV